MNLFELFVKIGVDDQASGKLSNLSSKLGNGLKTAAKIGTAAVGVAAAGITALTTAAVNNYAEYEQLVGGVDTLFKDASQKVQKYAANAYKTAGMSANKYMSTVTSFSASLLQSLSGDTDKAAEYANQALTDMSDNANKMGTSMEMIQNAYQGFAKQNYTMLDNLKLGYGGTKTEMERLIADAAELSDTVDAQSMSFANIVEAIHVVQTEMGITGTTAKEAASTIQGSVGMMKSSWTNLVTGIADQNANLDVLITNFVDSVGTVAQNIVPKIGVVLNSASKLISDLIPVIVQEIPVLIEENLPILAESAISIIQSLVDGISQNKEILFDTIFSVIEYISVSFIEMLPEIVQLGLDIILSLIDGILAATPTLLNYIAGMFTNGELVSKILEAIISLIEILITNIGPIVQKIIEIVPIITESVNQALLENFPALLQGIITLVLEIIRNLPSLVSMLVAQIGPIVSTIVQIIVENAPAFLMGIAQIVFEIVKAIPSLLASVGRSIMQVFSGIGTGLVNAWPKFKEGLNQIWVKMKDWFSSLGSKFIEIGSNIVDGIKRGISNAWKNLKTWFKNLFGDLIGIAKKILGIASPSKVFKGIGQFTAEGFGIGFEKEFDKVKSDIEKAMIFDNIEIGASVDRNKFYGSTNDDYDSKNGGTISIVQNIYSQAQTAADLMQEAIYQQEKAVLLGV